MKQCTIKVIVALLSMMLSCAVAAKDGDLIDVKIISKKHSFKEKSSSDKKISRRTTLKLNPLPI